MRVVMDGRPLQGPSSVRGIGSYARGLLSGFAELDTAVEFSLLFGAPRLGAPQVSGGASAAPVRLPVTHPTLQPVIDPFLVASALLRLRPDVYHAIEFAQPIASRVPTVATVHDLIPFVMPDDYPWVRRGRLLGLRLIRRAQQVIAVSEATRRDVVRIGRVDPARVTVIPEGIAATFTPAGAAAIAEMRARLRIARPYVLAVGTFDPRKRMGLLAAVARRVRATHDIDLVIAGDQGTFAASVRSALDAARIAAHSHVLGHVSFDDLITLYTGATCLVFTSAYEGFGLPPLESMACGTPAVLFDNSSLPEVAGAAGILVPDGNAERMAASITRLADDPEERGRRSDDGRRWAAQFTWKRAAAATYSVYERALGR